jgi:hypothetical protein
LWIPIAGIFILCSRHSDEYQSRSGRSRDSSLSGPPSDHLHTIPPV